MKKLNSLNTMLIAGISVFMFAGTSCNSGNNDTGNALNSDSLNNNPDSKKTAEEHNDAKFGKADEKDAQFMVDATVINMQEMQLGQLAKNNAMMDETKKLGAMMMDEHTAAHKDLSDLAATKSVSLPAVV